VRIARSVLFLLAYGGVLYLVTGGITGVTQRIVLAVIMTVLGGIAVKMTELIWRQSSDAGNR
jgi:hypothetical protein